MSIVHIHKLVLPAFVLAATVAISITSDSPASADFGVSDPTPGEIQTLAIDTNVTGNSGTSVPSVEPSSQAVLGSPFQIDVVVDEVPPDRPLAAMGFDLLYNPSVVRVIAVDYNFLITSSPPSDLFTFDDSLPDQDGDFRLDVLDLEENDESGEGVLVRFTLECVSIGNTSLVARDAIMGGHAKLLDRDSNTIPIQHTDSASIGCEPDTAVGGEVALTVTPGGQSATVWDLGPIFAIAAIALGGFAAIKRRA
jgi:hypothetical protein